MKLKSFKATSVYGYLDFDIKFNNDLNFLIGGNGSGKTSALRLINALCVPNFKDLSTIPFKHIEVVLEERDKEPLVISCRSHAETLSLKVSTVQDHLELSKNDENAYASRPEVRDWEEFFENLNRKYSDHPVVLAIASKPAPVFLGLDRKRDSREKEAKDFFYERERWSHQMSRRSQQSRRLSTSSLGISLIETEFLVQAAYRRLRDQEERQASRLKNSVLLSTFKYTEVDSVLLDFQDWKQRGQLVDRRKEIQEALSKLDTKDSRLNVEMDLFFDRLTKLFDELQRQKNEGSISIEWLINKAQVDRIANIVEVIDDHKSRIDSLYKPIILFLKVMNGFFIESHKELQIDTVGRIQIQRPNDQTCSIDSLSSGERQLLVIYAHAFFHKYSSRSSSIFIIDEPELSLHLTWQERFVPTLKDINPSIQYILATHSPEIIGGDKRKTIKCRPKDGS